MKPSDFAADGFELFAAVIPQDECESFAAQGMLDRTAVGSRCLLPHRWCAALAKRLRQHQALAHIIPSDHVAVQCTYFEKSAQRNWLVPVHQDLSIPVAERVSHPALGGWSRKEGALFVQAPVALLEQLVAVRLHLDACTADDGPLRVVLGSHRAGRMAPEDAVIAKHACEVSCPAEQGSVLALRPLLLHASSKSSGGSRRRVLHFVFGPRLLMYGLRWQHAV